MVAGFLNDQAANVAKGPCKWTATDNPQKSKRTPWASGRRVE